MSHPKAILALSKISIKPGTTKRDSLTITRRLLRYFCAYRKAIHDERRALRRKAAKLRQFEPFTKLSADTLEQQAESYGAEQLATIRPVLRSVGESLLHDRDGYMAALGFDGVCDVLNVNTMEREQARLDGMNDLAGLVFVHNLEDSASHRGEDFKRGPLFEACFAAMGHFIRTAPEGTLPDPFGPDGPLYGAPVRMVQPDGTVTIKRPDLTVHDASGSRVVKR
ncbi:hypothetical protein [Azotobacter chroococcum]|uniref:Uncharacterized protein n=1 Tax=Azotobacter chroococcum NCIMB 8003 TaxID=1328314 RepID=A0A0C4WKA0_9GAMM|nr:hypothetical protein [Azotobacter chroococcum]AJE20471.1 Hypothetical protein Achr_9890 [Azotobacter chroococcum NCIMB 8003]